MSHQVATAWAVLLIAVCGVVHGMRADRWQKSEELESALSRVPLVPMQIGAWSAEEKDSDARSFEQAGALAFWTRVYTNAQTRQSVLVILMCGRSGRMAVHTPEICYRGAGYDVFAAPTVVAMRGEADVNLGTFFTGRFAKSTSIGSDLRLYWGWNDGAAWKAPGSPRWEFRGRPYLYKLYVSQELGLGSNPDQDAAGELLRQLLPVMETTLKAGAS